MIKKRKQITAMLCLVVLFLSLFGYGALQTSAAVQQEKAVGRFSWDGWDFESFTSGDELTKGNQFFTLNASKEKGYGAEFEGAPVDLDNPVGEYLYPDWVFKSLLNYEQEKYVEGYELKVNIDENGWPYIGQKDEDGKPVPMNTHKPIAYNGYKGSPAVTQELKVTDFNYDIYFPPVYKDFSDAKEMYVWMDTTGLKSTKFSFGFRVNGLYGTECTTTQNSGADMSAYIEKEEGIWTEIKFDKDGSIIIPDYKGFVRFDVTNVVDSQKEAPQLSEVSCFYLGVQATTEDLGKEITFDHVGFSAPNFDFATQDDNPKLTKISDMFVIKERPEDPTGKPGEEITVGDKNIKLASTFDKFADGYRIGANEDKIFVAANNTDDKGIYTTIKSGKGPNGGNALVYDAVNGIDSNGVFYTTSYRIGLDSNAVKDLDPKEVTDLIFWIDATTESNSEAAFQMIISEFDYDKDGNIVEIEDKDTGNMVKQQTHRLAKNSDATKYYLYDSLNEKWEEKVGTEGAYFRIPNTFKGYVRVPLDTFEAVWESKDVNGKWDLRSLTSIDIYTGMYPRHVGNPAFAISNFGFAGTFNKPEPEPTTTVSDQTTTTKPDQTTTTKPDQITTTKPDQITATEPDQTTATKTDPVTSTTNGESSKSPSTGISTIILVPCLLTIIALGCMLVIIKKNKEKAN